MRKYKGRWFLHPQNFDTEPEKWWFPKPKSLLPVGTNIFGLQFSALHFLGRFIGVSTFPVLKGGSSKYSAYKNMAHGLLNVIFLIAIGHAEWTLHGKNTHKTHMFFLSQAHDFRTPCRPPRSPPELPPFFKTMFLAAAFPLDSSKMAS